MRFGIAGWLIRKGIEAVADRLFSSPLEKDFGEAREDDIILPDSRHSVCGAVDALEAPLARMFPMFGNLNERQRAKVMERLPELRIGRSVTYPFQVKDNGQSVELQMVMTKQPNHEVQIDFLSTEGVIHLVKLAFKPS